MFEAKKCQSNGIRNRLHMEVRILFQAISVTIEQNDLSHSLTSYNAVYV